MSPTWFPRPCILSTFVVLAKHHVFKNLSFLTVVPSSLCMLRGPPGLGQNHLAQHSHTSNFTSTSAWKIKLFAVRNHVLFFFCTYSIGPQLNVLPGHLWASWGPRGLTMNSALARYAPHQVGKAPHLAGSPNSWTSYTPPGPQPNVPYFLSACEIVQTSQSHSLMGTVKHPSLFLLQSLPPTASAGLVNSQVQSSCDPAWCVISSYGLWM